MKQLHRVGDIVTVINFNGTGEGILWRVTAVKGSRVRLAVRYCPTGKSVLNDKWVMQHEAAPADVKQLNEARAELDDVIRDITNARLS